MVFSSVWDQEDDMRPEIYPSTLQVKLPERMREELREAADNDAMTTSEYVRQAIRAQLRRADPEPRAA